MEICGATWYSLSYGDVYCQLPAGHSFSENHMWHHPQSKDFRPYKGSYSFCAVGYEEETKEHKL